MARLERGEATSSFAQVAAPISHPYEGRRQQRLGFAFYGADGDKILTLKPQGDIMGVHTSCQRCLALIYTVSSTCEKA